MDDHASPLRRGESPVNGGGIRPQRHTKSRMPSLLSVAKCVLTALSSLWRGNDPEANPP